MFTKVKSEQGIALVVVLILTAVMLTLTGAFMSLVFHRINTSRRAEGHLQCAYAAEAGLEQVKYRMGTSNYNSQGNVWLQNNSSPTGTVAVAGLVVGSNTNLTVDVTITGPINGWYIATADALIVTAGITSAQERISMHMGDRDLFSRYMFFTNDDNINIGRTTVRGAVHSNRSVNFYFGGAHMFGDVTCVNGIRYYPPASPDNTYFYGEVNGGVDPIGWPSTSEIEDLQDVAQGVYQVFSANSLFWPAAGNFNTEIHFHDDKVDLTAKDKDTGAVLRQYPNQDLPDNGLIFVQDAVTSLKGDIYGRCTVATMDKVDITDNIRYTDQDGDRAYELQFADGTPVPNYEGITDPWTEENGYFYRENPNYDPGQSSALGIMAVKDVTISSDAPYNMEQHTAIFSAEGNWHCDLSEKKGNLRVLGSMTHDNRGWRYNNRDYGWAKSGEYIYDDNFLTVPPEHWLEIDTPRFGAWRRGN